MKHTWLWCLVNSILVIMLIFMIHINIDIQDRAYKEVQNMRIELDTYKSFKQDTVIVNINNQIDIPRNVNVTYKCK